MLHLDQILVWDQFVIFLLFLTHPKNLVCESSFFWWKKKVNDSPKRPFMLQSKKNGGRHIFESPLKFVTPSILAIFRNFPPVFPLFSHRPQYQSLPPLP